MSILQCNAGVHTYSVSTVLTAKQYYDIKDKLNKRLTQNSQNYWTHSEKYFVDALEDQGIKLYLSKTKKLYRLKVRLEPCRVLGSNDPTALFCPTKKSYRKMVTLVDKLLSPYGIPISIDAMKICRLDITYDLYFASKELVHLYTRILQKSCCLQHYKRIYFKDNDKKVKDTQKLNKHSYRLQCKSASFSAYDKTAQLEMIGRCTDALRNANILRLEAALKRPALKQRIGEHRDNYHYLKSSAARAANVIHWYLKRLFKGVCGKHLRYQSAIDAIEQQHWKAKKKAKAKYLLRKTSDSASLDAALSKTQAHFEMKSGSVLCLLNDLNRIGIHPITLTNASSEAALTDLYTALKASK